MKKEVREKKFVWIFFVRNRRAVGNIIHWGFSPMSEEEVRYAADSKAKEFDDLVYWVATNRDTSKIIWGGNIECEEEMDIFWVDDMFFVKGGYLARGVHIPTGMAFDLQDNDEDVDVLIEDLKECIAEAMQIEE